MVDYHKHHIIPKHAGGTDDPSNIVKLTIEQHADAHKKLYEQYGNEYDRIAWKMLSGRITSEAARLEASAYAIKQPHVREKIRLAMLGNASWTGKHRSEETKQKLSLANKGQVPWTKGRHPSEETIKKLKLAHKGKKFSETHKQNIAKVNKGLVSAFDLINNKYVRITSKTFHSSDQYVGVRKCRT